MYIIKHNKDGNVPRRFGNNIFDSWDEAIQELQRFREIDIDSEVRAGRSYEEASNCVDPVNKRLGTYGYDTHNYRIANF